MNGEIYHILNRGVEKRKIFLDDIDYHRFVNNLLDFNNKRPSVFSYYNRRNLNSALRKPNDKLVDILSACLMSNHFHLIAQEKIKGGVGLFTKKISSGHTQYFNLKNERSGFLFQGRTKKILVKKEEHFMYLPYYLFSNPIKLIEPDWKEKGIKDIEKVINFLEEYKWMNFGNAIQGKKGIFSDAVDEALFLELFGFNDFLDFKESFTEWLKML